MNTGCGLQMQGSVERPDAIGRGPSGAVEAGPSESAGDPAKPPLSPMDVMQPARKKQRTGDTLHHEYWKYHEVTNRAHAQVLQNLMAHLSQRGNMFESAFANSMNRLNIHCPWAPSAARQLAAVSGSSTSVLSPTFWTKLWARAF